MKKFIFTAAAVMMFTNFSFAKSTLENTATLTKTIEAETSSIAEINGSCYDLFAQVYNLWISFGKTAEEAYGRANVILETCLGNPPAEITPENPSPTAP